MDDLDPFLADWARMVALLRQGGVMFVNDDPTKARAAAIGVLAHRGIAHLLAHTEHPSDKQVRDVSRHLVALYPAVEARSHRQKLTGMIHSYFWNFLPPAAYQFFGAELDLGLGRVDLLWKSSSGAVFVDEVKTGHSPSLLTSAVVEQVENYRILGLAVWPDHFLGIRLLSTASPNASLHVRANGSIEPLAESGLLRRKS